MTTDEKGDVAGGTGDGHVGVESFSPSDVTCTGTAKHSIVVIEVVSGQRNRCT